MKASVTVKKITFAALGALFGSFVMSGLIGCLIQKETIPISASKIMAAVIMFLSVLVACLAVVRKMPKSRLTAALAIAVVFVSLQLLLGGALFPVSEMSISWNMVLPVAAAVIAGVWSSVGKGHRR